MISSELKTEHNPIFNVGDYVIGDVKYITGYYAPEQDNFFINTVGEVIYKFRNNIEVKYYEYNDSLSNSGCKTLYTFHMRHATQEEIEQFILKKDINKYNL